jgi:predicted glycoside hydrolase/deacetylase ChbG (UPF0249 family)
MSAARYLIVNADDFGRSPGVNEGIIESHEQGVVTSASLMVRWPAAAAAAAYGRTHPGLSVGLHVDLSEWIYRDDNWFAVYEVVPAHDAGAVRREVDRQLAAFRDLMGRDPTHVDSHQHVHRQDPVRSVLADVADALAVPLRSFSPSVRYCGAFYGQTAKGAPYPEGLELTGLIQILADLAAGMTELGCHPGKHDDVESIYRSERSQEVNVLCDLRVRQAIAREGIQLCSFAQVKELGA